MCSVWTPKPTEGRCSKVPYGSSGHALQWKPESWNMTVLRAQTKERRNTSLSYLDGAGGSSFSSFLPSTGRSDDGLSPL